MFKFASTALATGLAAAALTFAPAPAFADTTVESAETARDAAFAADRETILALAGDFRVTFDMQESTAWMEGYEPLEPKISGGFESVRVVEDTGTRIVLQHLLVVGNQDEPYIVKHWRQDWEYEPARILTFSGGDTWEWSQVPADERTGSWSQTVWQVDDSPRYAGIGHWDMTNGTKSWVSNPTMRPLARRDAVRDPIYNHYVGVNRHQLTPNGWIHWQDNTKMMPAEDGSGVMQPVVQEYVLNTYERFDGYNIAAADSYWAATSDYWAAIRTTWDEAADANGGIRIAQQPQFGTEIAAQLLQLADAVNKGETEVEAATAEAVALIVEGTAPQSGG
ncbi:MAG: DUF6607 family protein [Pseudomonadota bacterium]